MSKPIITNPGALTVRYEAGASASELAQEFHTSTGVIVAALKRQGITLRSLSESAKLKLTKYGHPSTGKKHSTEARRKMRENHADFRGSNHPNFKGRGTYAQDGTYLTYDHHGYLRRYAPGHPLASKDSLIGEHVFQACAKWGVDHVRGKDVHHINAQKDDNQVENLVCLTRSEHRKLENKIQRHRPTA